MPYSPLKADLSGNGIVSAYGKKLSPTLSSHPKRTVSFARSFHVSAWSPVYSIKQLHTVYGVLGIGHTAAKMLI